MSKMSMDSDNVIRALSAEQVSVLTGLSKARLFSWDREGFFKPSLGDNNRRLPFSRVYSFEDVVELRTLAILRDGHKVPMTELRRVAGVFQRETERPWSGRKLYVLKKKVAFDEPESGKPRNITDGQFIEECIELKSVAEDMAAKARAMMGRKAGTVGRVERRKFVMSNSWVVAGTRIPTSAIKSFADEGYTAAQIIKEYPDLQREDIKAALEFEERRSKAA